ncbi:MAG: YhjD/YihY/BrkB family envelope integrity protein [Myxococcaceae bacterium]
MVAGGAWQVARSVYGAVAAFLFRFNPTYASLGAAPLFLVWIYLSWLLFLSGARLSYAVEHARMRGVLTELGTHPRARELIATRLAQLITATFERGLRAPNVRELSRALRIPAQRLDEILELLLESHLISYSGNQRGFIPGREPNKLTLADLSAAVGGNPRLRRTSTASLKGSEYEDVEALFAAADDASAARLQSVTWSHIANRLEVASTLTFEQDEFPPGT